MGVAAKPRILQRLRHAAAGAFSMDLKESLQPQLAAVLLERNTHLGLEYPSQSRWTEAAGRGQLLEGIQGQIVAQFHCRAFYGWMHFLKERCLSIDVKVPGLQQCELKARIVLSGGFRASHCAKQPMQPTCIALRQTAAIQRCSCRELSVRARQRWTEDRDPGVEVGRAIGEDMVLRRPKPDERTPDQAISTAGEEIGSSPTENEVQLEFRVAVAAHDRKLGSGAPGQPQVAGRNLEFDQSHGLPL